MFLFLWLYFNILLFLFLSSSSYLFSSPVWACGPSSLPFSLTVNAVTLGTARKFPDVNKNINPFASLLLPSSPPSLLPPFHKYFWMLSHIQRMRVEVMKPKANKTSACFSLVTNSPTLSLNSRIYHAAVHEPVALALFISWASVFQII